jgi:hypothetical protein
VGKLAALLALMVVLAGCGGPGVTGPCDDSDPVGICASSHSHVGGT